VRAGERHATELHIDTDEAHAFGVTNGAAVMIAGKGGEHPGQQEPEKAGRQLITEREVNNVAAKGEILQDCREYLVTPAARDRAKALGIWRSAP
jgi:hypothetical protein